MAADTTLTDIVTRSTRKQGMVLNGLAYACIALGLAIVVMLQVVPPKPGEEGVIKGVMGVAAAFTLIGIGTKFWVGKKMKRIRSAFLDHPATLTDVKVVTIQVNQFTTYAVHAKNPKGETLGLSVPNQAMARDVVARLQQAQPAS